MSSEKVEVRNVNHPGLVERVDAGKYNAMKAAMLAAVPKGEPGLTQGELREAVLPHLPDDLFPGGKTSGWWAKCVQLDLEARGIMARTATRPLRFFLA